MAEFEDPCAEKLIFSDKTSPCTIDCALKHIHSPHGHATLEDPRAGELEKQRPWWQREDSLMDVLNTLQLSLKLHYENEAHHLGQGELAV